VCILSLDIAALNIFVICSGADKTILCPGLTSLMHMSLIAIATHNERCPNISWRGILLRIITLLEKCHFSEGP